jgi:hypothetical protein
MNSDILTLALVPAVTEPSNLYEHKYNDSYQDSYTVALEPI